MASYVVDDLLLIAMADPKQLIDLLLTKEKFKLKRTGPISFHLRIDFIREADGTLCMSPCHYIDKVLAEYQQHFGSPPKPASSLLKAGSHPELDALEFLGFLAISQ